MLCRDVAGQGGGGLQAAALASQFSDSLLSPTLPLLAPCLIPAAAFLVRLCCVTPGRVNCTTPATCTSLLTWMRRQK